MNGGITTLDLRAIEEVLDMGDGYVLDFTNSTFAAFMGEHGVDIYSEQYSEDGGSKAKRLRCFLRKASRPQTGQVLSALLAHARAARDLSAVPEAILRQYREIVGRLGGQIEQPAVQVSSEAELLAKVFRPEQLRQLPFIAPDLAELLVGRMEQAQRCIEVDAHLSAVILCGSVLEGLCLGEGSHRPAAVNRAFASTFGRTAPQFHEWKLREWIDVLESTGDFSPNISKFGHALRDFRNYVHPHQQLASQFVPDAHTARISFHVVAAAIDSLATAQRVAP